DCRSDGGSMTDPRTQIAALANYHLFSDPNTTFLSTWGGQDPSGDWQANDHFWPAIAYNIGTPTETFNYQNAAFTWDSGVDPASPNGFTFHYVIYKRAFTNALVLFRPLAWSGTFGDGAPTADITVASTSTPKALGGSYQRLNADGTLGPVITSIGLMNGEGAILVNATPITQGDCL